MLTDIYDNAGIEPENLEITYQTEPDLNLLGRQDITIKLEDKAGNHTLIQVPVEVTAIANSETKVKLKIDRKLAPAPFKQEIQPHSKTFTSPGTRSSKHIRVSTLPSTGDQGMALKVALGGILVLIALLMLAIRKKKSSLSVTTSFFFTMLFVIFYPFASLSPAHQSACPNSEFSASVDLQFLQRAPHKRPP